MTAKRAKLLVRARPSADNDALCQSGDDRPPGLTEWGGFEDEVFLYDDNEYILQSLPFLDPRNACAGTVF
jgi:hypothetical protein